MIRHHRLAVEGGEVHPLEQRVDLRLGGRAARLQVLGPRYQGELKLAPGQCQGGAVVSLKAAPRPARIEFPCAPSGLTVVCRTCADEDRVYLAEDLPPIRMTSFTREVELLLRAPGFRSQHRRLTLHPGQNSVRLKLEPLSR